MIMPGIVTAGQALSNHFGVKRQYKYNQKAAQEQNRMNRENAEWTLEANRKLLREQLEYDSPANQMARFKAAGLNPHLIYGQGSSGNQGNPISIGNMPGANMGSVDASIPNYAATYLGATQAMASMQLTNAKEIESYASTQAKQMQTEIARTNPMLKPEVSEWVSASMLEGARLKAMENRFLLHMNPDETLSETRFGRKIMAEIESMEQRLGLNTQDLKIRNQILESKAYENALKEIQVKWMKDSEVTPEHFRQALMLLLGKMIGR